MAERYLGREFAVHGGGRDLIFPHHENEVAQSSAAGRPFAQVWAHNGMLRLSGEKMSKSLGNIEPLHEALDAWGAETFIMFLLRAHYASPVDYTDDVLEQARAACETLRNRLREGSRGERRRPALPARDRGAGRRLQHSQGAGRCCSTRRRAARDTVAEMLGVLGLGGLPRTRRRRPRWSSWPASARPEPRAAATSPCRRPARPDRRRRLGGARQRRRLPALPRVD